MPDSHADGAVAPLADLKRVARNLDDAFLDKSEIVRLLLISAIAGEHMLIIGPPGTAKSALVRRFARLIDARYFEYLLTRFTEPNELFGPVDIKAFREGRYTRRTEGMLPEAELVFLDEIFKSNSAILNSLLTLLNERRFAAGGQSVRVPLIALYGASNEVPSDESLAALFDRFLVRVVSDNLDSYHFHNLVLKGLEAEGLRQSGREEKIEPILSAAVFHELHRRFDRLLAFPEELLARYKGLVFQIRSEGVTLSDRRVVKLLKLVAASAVLAGRDQACDADLFVLKHCWNSLDQVELLERIVNPTLEAYYREHPDHRPLAGPAASLDDLLAELGAIRSLLTSGEPLSDIQLFSQLRNLNDIRAALQGMGGDAAQRMVGQIDQMLESVFASSRFG
jgi:MoxR-like ATPase